MKKLSIALLAIALISVLLSFTTTRIIVGKVTDEQGNPLPGVTITTQPGNQKAQTDKNGAYRISISENENTLTFLLVGYEGLKAKIGKSNEINVVMRPAYMELDEIVVMGKSNRNSRRELVGAAVSAVMIHPGGFQYHHTEDYSAIEENGFKTTIDNPLSTFSIDVDAASYSNIRRHINMGQTPPIDAVRVEEMINYFDYQYPQPTNGAPVNIITEVSTAPWNPKHHLVQIALQAEKIATEDLPPSNLVFLIDVSGSMYSANKLPLLKSAFKLLVDQLRENDRVAIVTYAGRSGLVLPSTSGNEKTKIKESLEQLEAGGSTAGGAGLTLAYKVAKEHFIKGGNNRIILASDGDFNVGPSSDAEMQRLVEQHRNEDIFISVLGFGMGNYKDNKMETIANKGNGNYAYIDNINEARKVLVNEFGGTLFTVAKDVKLQVEFNPAKVQAYRLVGYENRLLNNEDFNDDTKDAGDMGSGHTVTAFYEVIPAGVASTFIKKVDALKYRKQTAVKNNHSKELLTVKMRYKSPEDDSSQLLEKVVADRITTFELTDENFRFASAVSMYGMLLRDSEFKQASSYHSALAIAQESTGNDIEGYRAEFLKLLKASEAMGIGKKARQITSAGFLD